MSAKNLKVALQITADLNQARKEVKGLNQDIADTSKSASTANIQQAKLGQTAAITADQIKKMSSATDMKQGIVSLKDYEKGLNQTAIASKQVFDGNKMIEGSIRSLTPHLTALVGLSGGFIAIAVDTVNKAAELQNLSSVTGMGVEQFQYYIAGAKKVGVEQDKLADIFKDTQDKVGDFITTGGGAMSDFFEKIAPKVGVTAEQFKKLNGKDALQLYVDSLQKAGVSQNEMVFYLEAIASDATLLLPLLNNGGEAWKKYGDQAKAAGAILSQDLVNDAVKAKSAIGDFQNSISGVSNKLVANAAPAIVFVAENMDVLVRAGLILASLYAGKMVSATAAATVEFIKQRIAIIATEAAMIRSMGVATASTVAMRGLLSVSSLLTALGGLPGLAIAAAGVAASFLLMPSASDEATVSLDTQHKSVEELRKEYEALEATQQRTLVRDQTKNVDELTDSFRQQEIALLGIVRVIKNHSDVSREDKEAVDQLYKSYIDKKISADELATSLNKLVTINGDLKKRVDDQAGSTIKAKDELNKATTVLDVYQGKATTASNVSSGLSNNLDGIGSSADGATGKIQGLSNAFEDYIKKTKDGIFSNSMQTGLMNRGYSDQQARAITEARVAKGDINDRSLDLTAGQIKLVLAGVDSEKSKADSAERQKKAQQETSKELEKQQKLSEQTMKINSKVLDQAQKYNYADLENKFGLPEGILAAVSMQESKGNPQAKSPVGALGAFQFMPATAKQYGLNDRTDVQASAEAAAKYLSYLLKLFKGDLDKAIMAYNAGEGNVQSGKAYGFKETKEYLPSVKRYRAGYLGLESETAQSDLSKIDAAQKEYLAQLQQQQNEQSTIRLSFFTEQEKLEYEHQQRLKAIRLAGFGDVEAKKLEAQAEQDYQDKLTKRPEILKRIQDALPNLNQSWLRATDRGLEADLADIENKWNPILNDLNSAIALESDPSKKAELMDYQIKIGAVIDREQLTLRFNDAMQELDNLQSLRQQRQDNLKLKFDSGQISQPQYAEGLQSLDSEMKPQLESAATVARSLAEALGDAFNVERIDAFIIGLSQVDMEFKKFLPTAEQLNERIAGGLTDAIMDFADGTKSAGDAFKQFASDFLREIAQMILKQIIFNAIGGASGSAGSGIVGVLGSAFSAAAGSYANGGFTGFGGKYEPAGIVHRGEVVFSQEDVKRHGGIYAVEALRKFKGFADGGIVDAPNINLPQIQAPKLNNPIAEIAQSTSFNPTHNFYMLDDPARILDIVNSSQGQENMIISISRDPAKFRDALRIK